jgi:hypothetical protein
MNTKTSKPKAVSPNGSASKNGTPGNGAAPKTAMPKKSMYEKWIEKYGVDDSPTAQSTLEMWQMIYDAHNKPKS